MNIPPFLPVIVGVVAMIIGILFFWRRTGRLKTAFELAGAATVVVTGASALSYFETRADTRAQTLLTSMFSLGPSDQMLDFKRTASKGRSSE